LRRDISTCAPPAGFGARASHYCRRGDGKCCFRAVITVERDSKE
jgi:hypothetical protein